MWSGAREMRPSQRPPYMVSGLPPGPVFRNARGGPRGPAMAEEPGQPAPAPPVPREERLLPDSLLGSASVLLVVATHGLVSAVASSSAC